MRRQPFSIVILSCIAGFLLLMLSSPVSWADDIEGTGWVGRNKDGGIARLLEFRSNDIFVDMTSQYIYTGRWLKQKGKIGAAVQYRRFSTSGGKKGVEYIMYLAEVIDGKLKGASHHYNSLKKLKFWEFPFYLEPETTCAGERGICGDRLFCIDPATRKSITPIPLLEDPATRRARRAEKADDFLKAFSCAARLNMTGTIAARVRFPLTYVEIDRTSSRKKSDRQQGSGIVRRQVKASEFPKLTLWPLKREKERALMKRRVFDSGPTRDALGEHRLLLPPFPPSPGRSMLTPWPGGDTLWHFTEEGGSWFLDEVRECNGLRCPVALYCGEGHPKDSFPGRTSDMDEDFFAFFHTLYCAMHAGKRNLVFSRIRFPLPYELYHTEGGEKGTIRTPGKLELSRLYACDGRTMPPSMSVKDDSASASLSFGSGCGREFFFKNLNGKWHLVKIHFGEY